MILAVSNIAWSWAERLDAYAILREHGFRGLEVGPGLLFAGESDPVDPSDKTVRERLGELEEFGLTLVSMQSLLFGVTDAALFGSGEQRERFEQAMLRAVALAGRLGIGNLVFGSPSQRNVPPGMSVAKASDIAAATFRRLGDAAQTAGCHIALEPNPGDYGTNFLNDIGEVLAAVETIGHRAITVNFDIGALHMNGQFGDITPLARQAMPHVSHVHLSRPHLVPAPGDEDEARLALAALQAAGYRGAVSIEMRAVDDGLATLRQCAGRLSRAAAALDVRP